MPHPDPDPKVARLAGALYFGIVAPALWSEFGVRAGMLVAGDAAATAGNILARPLAFRLAFVADIAAATLDAALAALLYLLFRSAGAGLAVTSSVFRLAHSVLMAAALLFHIGALLILDGQGDAATALAFTRMHAYGYDLALVFFGVHLLALGALARRADWLPGAFAPLLAAGGAVYIAGSLVRFLAPEVLDKVQPAYIVPALAEIGLAGWLLLRAGRRPSAPAV